MYFIINTVTDSDFWDIAFYPIPKILINKFLTKIVNLNILPIIKLK